MPYVECVNISNVNEKRIEKLYMCISPERQMKARRFKEKRDRISCIVGEAMIRNHLVRRCGWNNNDIFFVRDSWHKPRLMTEQNIYFNLAHSGDWVICAWDDEEIGVDVETIRTFPMDAIGQLFHPDEVGTLIANNSDAFLTSFWTLKESYMKYKGMGFQLPMNSFCIVKNGGQFIEKSNPNIKFYQKKMDKDSILSLCTCSDEVVHYEQIDIAEILDLLICLQMQSSRV